jgi:hypothetical protein
MAEEQQHVRTMQRLEKLPVPGRGDSTDVFHNSQEDGSQEPWGPAHLGTLCQSNVPLRCRYERSTVCMNGCSLNLLLHRPPESEEGLAGCTSDCNSLKEACWATAEICSCSQTTQCNLQPALYTTGIQRSHAPTSRRHGWAWKQGHHTPAAQLCWTTKRQPGR